MTTQYDYFEVLPEHVTLLRHAYVRWDDCETGAPAIDCKRPYGNSDVAADMARLLGVAGAEDTDQLPQAVLDRLHRLHKETETALQIFLRIGRMEPGTYRTRRYYQEWEPVTVLPR